MPGRKFLCRKSIRTFFPAFLLFLLWSGLSGGSQEITLEKIMEKVNERLFAANRDGRWEALVVSTRTDADRNWRPEKVRQVTRRIRFNDGLVEEEILQAVEMEKGRRKDITEEYRRERLEAQRKMREQREKGQASEGGGRPRNSMNLEEVIPFSQKNRNHYDFFLRGETEVNGEKCYLLEARAREKKDSLLEGLFYISQSSFDLKRLELTPSRKPGVLKEFLMRIDLDTWQDRMVIKKTWIKIHGSFLIKNIRRIVEEEYSDYRLLESGRER